jgi:antitoxin component of RelBE/YafQ-DinJ toxin-antitoxin module
MNKRNNTIPEFKTLEEERAYWEARGPLAEGHKGTINKPRSKQKRSSFLAVRLTGEELTRLRNIAAKQGLGPSTFARMLLTSAIERQSQPDIVTLTEIKNMMENFLSQPAMEKSRK